MAHGAEPQGYRIAFFDWEQAQSVEANQREERQEIL
jgi:hypothetical protein